MQIIGLCGKKGVGKDFVADQLLNVLILDHRTVERAAFADPIKDFCINVLDLPERLVKGNDNDKNTPTKYSWDRIPEQMRNRFGAQLGQPMTIRHILQLFGTEICRFLFAEEIWTDYMSRRIGKSKADYFIITDVRFPNEIDLIKRLKGSIWEISGPQRGKPKSKDLHLSEVSLDKINVDKVIVNDLNDDVKSISDKVKKALASY